MLDEKFDELVNSAIIIDDVDEVYSSDLLDFFDEERRKEKRRENMENIAAATISAIVSRLCCHPFDVIKRHLQRTPALAGRTILHVAKIIYVERGLTGLWRSHGRAQFVSLLQTVTLFYAFENLRVQLDFTPGMAAHPNLCCYTAGVLSGAAAVLLLHPLEVMKIHHEAYNRIIHHLGTTKATQRYLPLGWSGCYRGFVPSLAHLSTLYGFKFLIYNAICDHLLMSTDFEQRHELRSIELAAAGACTGVLANMCVYPLDLTRQHMMTTGLDRQRYKFNSTCRRIGQCIRVIWRREGLMGLYNGLVPCLLRSAVNTALQFSIFDSTIHALRDADD